MVREEGTLWGLMCISCSVPAALPRGTLCKWGWFCSLGRDAFQSLSNPLRRQVETQLTPESASRTCRTCRL